MQEEQILKNRMTMGQMESALRGQAVRIVTMKINDWFVRGQIMVLVAFTMTGQEFPFVKYKCVESGKQDSVWEFDSEIYARRQI